MSISLLASITVFLALVLVVTVLIARASGETLDFEAQRASIDQALLAHAGDTQDTSIGFDRSKWLLIHTREERGRSTGWKIQAHRVYRSELGQYFLFICTAGERGYLTHLSRERAMTALRTDRSAYEREFPEQTGEAQDAA